MDNALYHDLLRELRDAHAIIANGLMTGNPEHRYQWAMRNAESGINKAKGGCGAEERERLFRRAEQAAHDPCLLIAQDAINAMRGASPAAVRMAVVRNVRRNLGTLAAAVEWTNNHRYLFDG